MTQSFMPTKDQWNEYVREVARLRIEQSEVRALFAHLPGPESETLIQLCTRVARMHAQQAETIAELRSRQDELAEALGDVINQACYDHETPNVLDSLALAAYAKATHLLAELGRITILQGYGRRVLATRAMPPTELEYHGVELPSGSGIAHVSRAVSPETLAALDEMMQAAVKQVTPPTQESK